MPATAASASISRRIVKWLLRLCYGTLFVIILLGVALILLPRMVSTEWFKRQLEEQAFQILQRPVSVEQLRWTWSRGILLEGLQVADDPSFSNKTLFSIDRALLALNFKQLLHRRVVFNLKLEGLNARLIRSPDSRTNFEHLFSPAKVPEKSEPASTSRDWRAVFLAIPIDIQGGVQLSRMGIQIEDRTRGHMIAVHDASLLLEMPSLLRKPITITWSMEEEIDGLTLPPIHLMSRIENLFDSKASLNLSKAKWKIEGLLPGGRIEARGLGLGRELALQGKVKMDLASLANMVRPFIPSTLPDMTGSMELDWDLSGNPGESIMFNSVLIGKDLTFSGGPLKGSHMGPVQLRAHHEGTVDIPKGVLDIKRGEIQVQKNTRLSWRGTLDHLKDASPVADLTMTSLSLDLEELYPLVKEFVPAGILLHPEHETDGLARHRPPGADSSDGAGSSAELRIENIRFRGPIPEGPNQVEFKGLFLNLPYVHLATPAGPLDAKEINFQVSGGDAVLESFFPTRVGLSAGFRVRNIHLKGAEVVEVERMEVPSFQVAARDIALSSEALFGITGRITLQESGVLEGFSAPHYADIPKLRQSMEAEFILGPGPTAKVHVKRVAVSSPSIHFKALPQGAIETGLELEADVTGLHLLGLNPLRIDWEKVRVRLDVGELFQARMEALARDLGRERLDTSGQITLNVGNLALLLPPDLLPKVNLVGTIEAGWEFLGRLPGAEELDRLFNGDLPLTERLRQTEFMKKFQLVATLRDFGADLSLSKDSSLRVSQIRSATPLKLTLKDGLQQGEIVGKLIFGRIEELPSIGKLIKPIQATLSFSGSQKDLKTVQLFQTMHVDPLNVDQSLRVSLNRMDKLLINGWSSLLPALFKQAEGVIRGSVQADLDGDLSRYLAGLFIKGRLAAGAEFHLAGGREIKARSWLKSPGLDIRWGSGFQITRLQSDINLEKSYRLFDAAESAPLKDSASPPLSVEVLNPQSKPQSLTKARESLLRRLIGDLRGRLSRLRSLSFDSARIQLGPLPIEISNYELEFRLRSLPTIDYFQFDLLGGTVVGSLSLSGKKEPFLLKVECWFSGLNANKFLSGVIQGVSDEEAELSGKISLWLPLSTDPREVLHDLRVNVDLTHIGSRALERFLYAIDPHESHETVVQQRNLLRVGSPRWIQLKIQYGNLSMSGELEVKGVRVNFPPIERVNVANLPVHQRLEESLSALGPIVDLLKTISADGILLGPEGAIRFVSWDS